MPAPIGRDFEPLEGIAGEETVAAQRLVRQGTVEQVLTPHRTLVHKGHLVGRQIRVVTDPRLPVELDGETVTATPLDVTVDRNALLMMVPDSFADT